MSSDDYAHRIKKMLDENNISAMVAEKGISGDPHIEITASGVNPENDIEVSALVQRILRDIAGYGTFKADYDPSGVLTMSYKPLRKEGSGLSWLRFTQSASYQRTPGPTLYRR